MAHPLEYLDDRVGQCVALVTRDVGQPLRILTGRVDGVADVHAEIHRVEQDVQRRVDDRPPAR